MELNSEICSKFCEVDGDWNWLAQAIVSKKRIFSISFCVVSVPDFVT